MKYVAPWAGTAAPFAIAYSKRLPEDDTSSSLTSILATPNLQHVFQVRATNEFLEHFKLFLLIDVGPIAVAKFRQPENGQVGCVV